MGRQIIKQPNGKYCIFSSIIDNITHYDMSVEEIIEVWTEEAKNDITERVRDIINKLENCEKPYYQFTHTYDGILITIEQIHGKKESQRIKSIIENK